MVAGFFVVHPGLEPRRADPESDVLPLHQWTITFYLSRKVVYSFQKRVQKYYFFLNWQSFFSQQFTLHWLSKKYFFIQSLSNVAIMHFQPAKITFFAPIRDDISVPSNAIWRPKAVSGRNLDILPHTPPTQPASARSPTAPYLSQNQTHPPYP